MDQFDSIAAAVQSALEAGRIGQGVAVRIVDHGAADQGQIEGRLVRAIQAAARWLQADVQRLAALGSVETGQVSVLGRTERGLTILASAGLCGQQRSLFALTAVGAKGVIDWQPDGGGLSECSEVSPTSSVAGEAILSAVRESLTEGRAVALKSAPAQLFSGARSADVDSRPALQLPAIFAPPAALDRPPWGVLLVAGSHTHQENYGAALAADRRCRLIGLSDAADISPRRRALNERLARELNIPLLPDLSAALRRDDVQIVSICAEPERRAAIIVQAAAAGKHLYLDKPLAACQTEARTIVEAIRRAGVHSQMFSLAQSPAAQRVRRLAASGALGQLRAVHADQFFAKGHVGAMDVARPRAEALQPRVFETIEAKREFYNVGVYPAVLLPLLFQRPARRVWALTGNYFFAEHARHDMEDFGAALVDYGDGATGTIMAGRTGWRSHPASGLNRTCLIGSNGAAAIDAFRPRLEVWTDEPAWSAPRRHPDDPMGFWSSTQAESGVVPKRDWLISGDAGAADARHFLDGLEQNRESDVPASLAADALSLLLAAYRSSASGEFVQVVL